MEGTPDADLPSPAPPNVKRDWDDDEPPDQTPPPDHEEFELVSAAGRRAIGERWERRRRNREGK